VLVYGIRSWWKNSTTAAVVLDEPTSQALNDLVCQLLAVIHVFCPA